MSHSDTIVVGSIVQVDPLYQTEGLGGCLLIVSGVDTVAVVALATYPDGIRRMHSVPRDKVEATGGIAPWITEAMQAAQEGLS